MLRILKGQEIWFNFLQEKQFCFGPDFAILNLTRLISATPGLLRFQKNTLQIS